MRRLFYENAPVFADFDEEGYRTASLARGETAGALLDTIVAEHEQLARLLQTLPDAHWSREGRHPTFGVMSIEFLARRWASTPRSTRRRSWPRRGPAEPHIIE